MPKINPKPIERYITENKISKTEFCRRCSIGQKTLKGIYEEKDDVKNAKVIALFKIARVLGIRISDLLYDE